MKTPWLEQKKFEVINCQIIERYIVADSLDDFLFGSLKCSPTDGACALPNSFIIWNRQDLIYRCPLYYVTSTTVMKKDNFLISEKDNYIFNIVEKVNFKNCQNITFFKSKGLFLTHDDKAITLPTIDNEIVDVNKLALAENDMKYYTSFESQRHLAFEVCLTLENIIKVASLSEDKFLSFTDVNEKEVIIYLSQGQAYVVKCYNLVNSTIKILNIPYWNGMCDIGLPIEFGIGNHKFKGYLDINSIIKPYSEEKCLYPCKVINQRYFFKNNIKSLHRNGSNLKLVDDSEKIIAKPINFGSLDISKLNFKHSKKLVDGIDFAREFSSYSKLSSSFVENNEITGFKEGKNSYTSLYSVINNYLNYAKYFSIAIIIIMIILTILSIIFRFQLWKFKCLKCKWLKRIREHLLLKQRNNKIEKIKNIAELIEMQNLTATSSNDKIYDSKLSKDSVISEFKSKVDNYSSKSSKTHVDNSISPSKVNYDKHIYLNDSPTIPKASRKGSYKIQL